MYMPKLYYKKTSVKSVLAGSRVAATILRPSHHQAQRLLRKIVRATQPADISRLTDRYAAASGRHTAIQPLARKRPKNHRQAKGRCRERFNGISSSTRKPARPNACNSSR